jgi:hypothetical protein
MEKAKPVQQVAQRKGLIEEDSDEEKVQVKEERPVVVRQQEG